MTVPGHVGHCEPFFRHVDNVDVAVDVAGLNDVLVLVKLEVVVGGLHVPQLVYFVESE